MRKAFTLIEVMVAVVIISVVIMAILELYSNNSHIFSTLGKKGRTNQYASFIIANPDYGFENKKTNLYELLSDFDLENDLRRRLKETKVEVIYQELEIIDMAEFDEEGEESLEIATEDLTDSTNDSGMIFEIRISIVKLRDASASLIRIQVP